MINTTKELYRIFDLLNEKKFGKKLEEPVILIQSSKKALGTCSVGKIWQHKKMEDTKKYEITITAESLNRTTLDICETMLHEMVHLHCSLNDIKDTSNNFVYHNKKYKEEAEAHGLEVAHMQTYGYALTKLNEESKKLIETFNVDETAFEFYRKSFGGGVSKPLFKYECPDCKMKISNYKAVNLICGNCNKNLVERI